MLSESRRVVRAGSGDFSEWTCEGGPKFFEE